MNIILSILSGLMKIFSIIPRPKKRKTDADTSEERKRLSNQEENASEKKKTEIHAIGVMKQVIELKNKMNKLENDVFTKIYITEFEKVKKRLDEQESRLEDLKQSVEEKESLVPYVTPAKETFKEDKGAPETVSSFPIENLPETAEIPLKELEIGQKIVDELKSRKNASPNMEQMLSIIKDIPEKDAIQLTSTNKKWGDDI
jgi:archaellum component FlaC